MLRLKHFRDEAMGLADLLDYAAVIADGVILGKDGSLLAGWYFRGHDADSATPDELNVLSARINTVLGRFGGGWMLQVDAIRRAVDLYPMPEKAFPDEVSQGIDDERRRMFCAQGAQFETIYALFVTYLPPLCSESRFYGFLVDDPKAAATMDLTAKHLAYFEKTVATLEGELSSSLNIQRIRSLVEQNDRCKDIVFDQMLQYINFTVTGENHPVRLPSCPMYIDAILGWREFGGGLLPKIGDKYIGVIGIDGFPQDSHPVMLAGLDQLSCEYRWHSRFIFMDRQQAIAHLKSYRKKWGQKVRGFIDQILQTNRGPVDQNALSMVAEIDQSLAVAESGTASFGYYTSVVVLMEEHVDILDEKCREIMKVIRELGFGCRRESLNAIEAWLGSLPSHGVPNVRRPLMHTLNVADLLPVTAIWAGEAACPSSKFPVGSPPLLQAFTGGNTPVRFNLHVSDVGHFLIVGPTGSGKSTLIATLVAQFRRYQGAKIFAFDKGYSLFPLTMGMDGIHYDVAAEESRLQFCPLANIDQSAPEQGWAEQWIGELCELQGVRLNPGHVAAIHRAMSLLVKAERKTLTDFVATLQHRELREALQHYTVSGAMGYLLDAEQDSLALGSFQCFEIEHLMNLGDKNALPVLRYIFHRIEGALDGHPAILVIDEAWIALKHPLFKEKITEWLKVLRKANVAVGLATQSLHDLLSSGILDVITESCPTKIFLANPEAGGEFGRQIYQKMGLNERQLQIIAGMAKYRDYYAISPKGRRRFELGLGAYALRWLSGLDKEPRHRLQKLMNDHPAEWRKIWSRGGVTC